MNRATTVGAGLVVLAASVGLTALGVSAQGQGDAKAGEAIYKLQCAKCHGDTGAGDGKDAAKLKEKPTDWTKPQNVIKALDDQKIYVAIAKGGPAIGKARTMPAYPKLAEKDVWNLVAYVKTLAK
jgi:mono/diheme cytochrome c family protein